MFSKYDDKVLVIDSIMGTGKTFTITEYMKKSNKCFVYITPLLKEVEKMQQKTHKTFEAPKRDANNKYTNFLKLLSEGKNIATTHSLFKKWDNNVVALLKEKEYELILDETTEPIEIIKTSKTDMLAYINNKIFSIDKDGSVIWSDSEDNYDGRYPELKKMAESKSLKIYGDIKNTENLKLMVWTYPKEIFECFTKIFVLTYLFDGSLLKNYFDLYNITYKKLSIKNRMIVDYAEDKENKLRIKSLITVFEGKLNNVGDTIGSKHAPLCTNWFKNTEKLLIKLLKSNLYNYFKYKVDTTFEDLSIKEKNVMWTTLKDYFPKLKGDGNSKRIYIM